jgi:hypothetical protein
MRLPRVGYRRRPPPERAREAERGDEFGVAKCGDAQLPSAVAVSTTMP